MCYFSIILFTLSAYAPVDSQTEDSKYEIFRLADGKWKMIHPKDKFYLESDDLAKIYFQTESIKMFVCHQFSVLLCIVYFTHLLIITHLLITIFFITIV